MPPASAGIAGAVLTWRTARTLAGRNVASVTRWSTVREPFSRAVIGARHRTHRAWPCSWRVHGHQRWPVGFSTSGQISRADYGIDFGPMYNHLLGDVVTFDPDLEFHAPE
jgi:hypothetical protein